MGEATRGNAPQQEHIVRIPYSLEIEDKLPRGMRTRVGSLIRLQQT